MKKTILFSVLFLMVHQGFSQANYPTDYFINPLEVPLILSGTFGELRTNHFHGGLDIKTQQREGLNVVSAADGYISRIKISHWGYGKALYVTHPNGYSTVYGHLKKFAPEIEAYVKKHQYQKESYTIELFPKANVLKVKKGELIAYSGNSGSSGGPHLHFEIRDGKANPINPMHFGIEIPDHKAPLIRAGVVYSFGDSTHVNGSNSLKELIIKNKNGNLVANPIEAYGKIGVGVNAVDKLDGALNNNGIFNLQMIVNGKKVYEHQVSTFSFAETRYINTLIDYNRYFQKRQKIQKCFVEPSNKLSIYKTLVNNGYLIIEDGLTYNVEVIAKDFEGNSTKLIIPIKGKKSNAITKKESKKTPHFFRANEFNKLNKDNISVAFPKNSFYEDIYFDFNYNGKIVKLHDAGTPLHRNFTLTFDISNYPTNDKSKVIITSINKNGRLSYASTKRKGNKLYTLSRSLGNYTLAIDSVAPKISPVNFKNKQWLSNYRYLKLKITDNLSGIKSYRGEINGKWVLFEYEPKKNLLTYDFNDNKLEGNKHELKLTVVDNANNTNVYIASFNTK